MRRGVKMKPPTSTCGYMWGPLQHGTGLAKEAIRGELGEGIGRRGLGPLSHLRTLSEQASTVFLGGARQALHSRALKNGTQPLLPHIGT